MENPSAERGVIAGICKYGSDAYIEVEDLVRPNFFSIESNQVIYNCLQKIFEKDPSSKIDVNCILSTSQELGYRDFFYSDIESKHLRAMFNDGIDLSNVRKRAATVAKLAVAREIHAKLGEARSEYEAVKGDESLNFIISIAENKVFNLTNLLDNKDDIKPIHHNINEWLQNLIDNPRDNIGISSGMPLYDRIIGGGFRRKAVDLIAARAKQGKALKNGSKVYTPNGTINIEDCKIGNIVCTPNGVANITGVFHQGIVDVYRVQFSDGDYVDCSKDHLWKAKSRRHNDDKKYKILSVEKLLERIIDGNRPKWQIPLNNKCQFSKKDIELDPYFLGLMIGDGCLRNAIKFTNTDEKLVDYVKSIVDDNYCWKLYGKPIDYSLVKKKRNGKQTNIYRDIFRKLGLWNKLSIHKFIPKNYIYNTEDVRLAILQGLMDTDGYADEKGNCVFYTSSITLAKDVKEIVQSLGGLCTISNKKTKCNGKIFHSFHCGIHFNDCSILFRLERKKKRCHIRTKPDIKRVIKSIELIGQSECTCISIDSEDGLFLTDNYVVTHNTTCSDNIALHISGKLSIPVLNLDSEMDQEQHMARILANLAEVPKREIETGKFAKNKLYLSKVRAAKDKLLEIPYDYLSIAGMEFEEVLSNVRRWLVKRVGKDSSGNIKDCLVIYDYFKLMTASSVSNHMQEYQALGFQMTSLTNFVNRHDVPCCGFVQLNRDGAVAETAEVISGSDRLAWFASSVSIFKKKTDDEVAEDGVKNGNRKLIPVLTRHGELLEGGDYINMKFEGDFNRITELNTRNQIKKDDGFEITEEDS